MLNSTLVATERTLCCLLENYQTETGVNVPEVLQPFCYGLKFIPFVKELPKEEPKKEQPKKENQPKKQQPKKENEPKKEEKK